MYRVRKRTWGTETSKYPEEKKETSIPSVAASESGTAQTVLRDGVWTSTWGPDFTSNRNECRTREGDSPVAVKDGDLGAPE